MEDMAALARVADLERQLAEARAEVERLRKMIASATDSTQTFSEILRNAKTLWAESESIRAALAATQEEPK